MRQLTYPILLTAVLTTPVFLAGCSSNAPSPSASSRADPDHGHSHAHGETGPHGGHLIELGRNHKYHAELVQNDSAESVIVYILDTHMKELAIGESSIILNLTADGETTAYEMLAAGDGHSAGHSHFASTDQSLFRALEQRGGLSGKLRVTIEGVPYVGRIAHLDHAHNDSTHRH